MIFTLLLPFLIGAFGVLQNTWNAKFAGSLGLPLALIVNNLVLLGCSLLLLLAIKFLPPETFPELFRQKQGWDSVGAKNLLPGLLGFFIIATAPWAIEKVGATRVFLVIIAAQIILSVFWDWYVESIAVNGWRVAGGALALLGAVLASF